MSAASYLWGTFFFVRWIRCPLLEATRQHPRRMENAAYFFKKKWENAALE
jgi:hypothetical protein